MSRTYEGMFLIDNELVRTGWQAAKSVVGKLLEKHGGTVHTARRWEERRLAYPIRGRNRATYLLVHYELPSRSISSLVRDLDINESVLRYLLLRVDAVPEEERRLAAAEEEADFLVPEPPADDTPEELPPMPDDSDDDDRRRPPRTEARPAKEEPPAKEEAPAKEGGAETTGKPEPALASAEREPKSEES